MTANRITMGVVAALGAVALGGCEIALPILALTSDDGSDDYYAEDPYYYSDGYYGELDVEVENLSGVVGGRALDLYSEPLSASGSQSGASAYFALSVGEGGTEPTYGDDAGVRSPSGDDLTVTLDVCPIEEYANGGAIEDPSSEYAYLNFYVCDSSYNCLDGYSGDLDINVVDGTDGVRRVQVTGTWSSGDRVDMTLRYDPSSE